MPDEFPLTCAELANLVPAESEACRRHLEIAFWRGQLQVYGPKRLPIDPRSVVQSLQFGGGDSLPPLDDEDDLPAGLLDPTRREQLVETYLARYIAAPPTWEPFWRRHLSKWKVLPSRYAAWVKSLRGGRSGGGSRQADRDRQAQILNARGALRSKGMRFRDKKAEHAAVLEYCGISSEPLPRGWGYTTYCRLTSSNSQ